MSLSEAEYVALVAEAIRRSVGVQVDDIRLGLALAMIDEAEGRRTRRARKSIATLRPLVGTEEDLSLTAAIPTFRFALAGYRVHVLFRDDYSAAATHRLYQRIADELRMENGVGLIGDQTPDDRLVNYNRAVVIGGVVRFSLHHAALTWRKRDHVGILRVPEDRAKYARRYKRLTVL